MKGGIKLDWKKDSSLVSWSIRRVDPPEKVRISTEQFSGPRSIPCVKVGDHVQVGETIAKASGPLSLDLHASISGKVTALSNAPNPTQERSEAIEIISDGLDKKIQNLGKERTGWESLSPQELMTLFQKNGLVTSGMETLPLHVKAMSSQKTKTIVINGCESEPYVTCTHSLMMSHAPEILKGAEILRRACEAENVIMVTEEDKLEPAEILRSKIYFLKWKHFQVHVFPIRYPQSDESVLVREKKRLGFNEYDPDPLVFDATSAFAAYEAIVLQKPFYERALTVGGECVVEAKNFWARIGTDAKRLVKNARGLLREPRKFVLGGPMRGLTQSKLEIPIVKDTSAVLALPKEVAKPLDVDPCTRCGRCADHCPVGISPAMITLAAEKDLFEMSKDYGVEACTQCGNCAYVCPSKRPMIDLIRYALEGATT